MAVADTTAAQHASASRSRHDPSTPAPTPVDPPERAHPLSSLDSRLVLFGGRGGVGKTVFAAALADAWARAEPQRPVSLLSLDPAHSLADAFAGEDPPDNLKVEEVDAGLALRTFKEAHDATLAEIARRGTFLDEEDIADLLDLSTPGLDELLALLRIPDLLAAEPGRRVILDTAPYGHTTRLLGSIWSADRWLDALDALLAKHRFLAETFARGYKADETDALIDDLRGKVRRLQRLLTSAECRFVIVAVAEPLCLGESVALHQELQRRSIRAGPLILNRRLAPSSCRRCAGSSAAQHEAIAEALPSLRGLDLLTAPLLDKEPLGRRGLAELLAATAPLDEVDTPTVAGLSARAMDGRPLRPSVELILVTGKGGVGKTTVAAALALAAAESREVMLLSADPAPSLTSVLRRPIGPAPTSLGEHLSARTLDAAGLWQLWCDRYRDELEAALVARLGGLDLTFDRAVLERLLDLTPPGIDEVVATAEIIDLLADDPERLIVLDTAATGHFLRLLGTPELLQSWIRAFFRVLIKYRETIRLPQLSDRLIALSKQIKRLRALLADPERAQVWVVTVPTRMAEEEACDLLRSLEKAELTPERIIVNHTTAADGECRHCAAIRGREAPILARWRSRGRPLTIERGAPPLGRLPLLALGRQLIHDEARG